MSRERKLLEELKKRATNEAFSLEKFCFDKQLQFISDPAKFKTGVCSRRAGKCQKEGTLVLTPQGARAIEDIKPGDTVYGYNMDGSISETKVIANINQGVKEVVDIKRGNRVLLSCTKDHPLVMRKGPEKYLLNLNEVTDFNRTFLERVYVPNVGGDVAVPEAYALGALLGDGCSRSTALEISSGDRCVVEKVAKCLGAEATKRPSNNFTWGVKGRAKHSVPHYIAWLHGKYAHEKIADYNIIRLWDRASQLEFLAGLFDTDGSISALNNRLTIRLGMQAKSVIDCAKQILISLFQVNVNESIDKRSKYVNGPVHNLCIATNFEAARVLKELSPYLQCERKKWKPEYSSLYTQNAVENMYGLKNISEPYKAQTYDLSIDNETKLYVLANGIVTHNTIACAADLFDTALKHPGVNVLYITLSRTSAKRIVWKELLKLQKKYAPEAEVDKTELTITLKNESTIYLSGAKDETEMEKFRGLALKKVYIDECQSFRPYIENLVDDILVPALFDYDGSLCLIGTPGPNAAGYFYNACHNSEWANYKWTILDNPWIKIKSGKEPAEILAAERKRRGITESDPTYMRESLGLWVQDNESLVFRFDAQINRFYTLPEGQMEYIFGIDIGYNDADAVAVLGYSYADNRVYLVEEYVRRKQDITSLVNAINGLRDKYKPVRMVMDAGALGKKIQAEIQQRHQIPLEAADKNRKLEFIALLNDDLRTGRFKSFVGSQFEEDCSLVQWDRSNPEKPKISDIYHTDIGDAVLYAWRECKHYLYKPEPIVQIPLHSAARIEQFWEDEAEKLERAKQDPDNVDQDEFESIYSED